MMFFRFYRWLILLLMMLLLPYFMGGYLQFDSVHSLLDASSHTKDRSPVYNRVHVNVYDDSGKLDYRLDAQQIVLRESSSFDAIMPDVHIIDHRKELASYRRHPEFVPQNLRVKSKSATFASGQLSFYRDVDVLINPIIKPGASGADLRSRLIKAQRLNYVLNKRYFEAQDQVHYCYGVQEVFADKAHGYIDNAEYTFDNGRIVFRKRPRC